MFYYEMSCIKNNVLLGSIISISYLKELLECLLVVCVFVTGISIVHIPFEDCLVPFNISFHPLVYTKNVL